MGTSPDLTVSLLMAAVKLNNVEIKRRPRQIIARISTRCQHAIAHVMNVLPRLYHETSRVEERRADQ